MSDPFKDFLEELERRRGNGAPQPTEASESEPDSDAPPSRTRARRPGGAAPTAARKAVNKVVHADNVDSEAPDPRWAGELAKLKDLLANQKAAV